MNIGDSIRNSNSWHWLCAAVVAASAASVFLPTYGWRDVLQFAGQQLASDETRAQKRLEETRALAAVDVVALSKETGKAKKSLAEAKAAFAKYGIEELPTGDKAVFSEQSRVGEALNRRRLRVISTEARVAGKKVTSAATHKRTSSSLPFKTETLDYRVAGDFRDVFMFFVAETHRKPYYNFKDISASVGENGMDLAFTLQVNHR
jgi:hypothetical protein